MYFHPAGTQVLYDLLRERDETINISHKRMPSWDEHIRFVESAPYEAWYLICDPDPLGSIYLSRQNEIGVFVFKEYQGLGYGRRAIKALMEKHGKRRYLANINPRNERSANLFASLGFNLIQHTYELA